MALTRRQFLTLAGGSATGAIIFAACGVPEQEQFVQGPLQMPEDMVSGLSNWYATLCRGCCPTSEGLVVRVMEGRAKKIEGNVDYPINQGKHSARCEAGLQALYHPDRIRGPMVRTGERGSGQFEEISWTDAIGRLTYQLENIRGVRQQSSVVMVTEPTGGHMGTVIDAFAARYRARHMAYEALEQTNLRRAIQQVFSLDRMPDFDIDNAAYVLSFGADFLSTWVSPVRYSRGYGEFRQGERERGTLVQVESRFSMTAANADEWLYVRPGQEGLLALSMAHVIAEAGLAAPGSVEALTGGDTEMLAQYAPEQVADRTGVPAVKIRRIAHDFAASGAGLAIGGGSAAAHSNGLSNLAAIYSLNHLVGNYGQAGGIIPNPPPPIESLASVAEAATFEDWQELVGDMKQGDVQALLVRGANPVYGLPSASGFRDATYDVPLIVSFSGFMDDTTAMSDLVLPEHNYLEDWGNDVPTAGPGYEMVGFQQPVVRPFFEGRGEHLGTRNFADVLMTIAQGLELDLELPGETFKDILQDGARQLFELGRGSVTAESFPHFWHGVLQRGGWWDVRERASAAPPETIPALPAPQEPAFDSDERFRFNLIPFASTSLGDGSGAFLPWLQATPDPVTTATWQTWVEINLEVAKDMDISEGDVIRVTSANGFLDALAYPHPGVSPDVVSIPMGQGHTAGGRYAEGRGANVLSILSPSVKDEETGALAWAATRVNIEKMGDWIRLPKFENTVPYRPADEHREVLQITRFDS